MLIQQNNGLAVPTHFFRVFFPSAHKEEALVWILPNEQATGSGTLDSFRVGLAEVERWGLMLPEDLGPYFGSPPPGIP